MDPVRPTRCVHACCAAVRRAFIESTVAGVPQRSQLVSGRQVGWAKETRTNLPFACGSQAANAALSGTSGRITTGARTILPFGVPGLQASIIPSSERTRGATRSMCVVPRRQPRHVPYRSLRAGMPQARYVCTSQSCAASMEGEAVSRGPSESSSTWASGCAFELSMPRVQRRRSTGFSTVKPEGCGKPWAGAEVAQARTKAVKDAGRSTVSPRESCRSTDGRELSGSY